jgi:hypothetical protein
VAVWIEGNEQGGRCQMRAAGIGGGGMQLRGTTGGMSRRRGRGRVKGLDLRREPRCELPEENGGDGRVRVEPGGGQRWRRQ